eukprot:579495-Rhodomonas_salina.2
MGAWWGPGPCLSPLCLAGLHCPHEGRPYHHRPLRQETVRPLPFSEAFPSFSVLSVPVLVLRVLGQRRWNGGRKSGFSGSQSPIDLNGLVTDMLETAEIMAGNFELAMDPVNLVRSAVRLRACRTDLCELALAGGV